MQKLFDDQVKSIDRDRASLMGTSDWANSNLDTVEAGSSQRSIAQLTDDQKKMLGGKQLRFISNLFSAFSALIVEL